MDGTSLALRMGASAAILLAAALYLCDRFGASIPALLDETLSPPPPKGLRPDSRIGVTRTVLEALLTSRRAAQGDEETVAQSPLQVKSANIPRLGMNTIPLDEPIGAWSIAYDGGRTATATAPDGIRLLLDARQQTPGGRTPTVLTLIVTDNNTHELIRVRAKTLTTRTRYRTTSWGGFQKHKEVRNIEAGTKSLYNDFTRIDGAT